MKPENLHEVTDKVLFGLSAGESLKHRILQNAAGQPETIQKRVFYPVPVLCAVVAMLVLTVAVLNGLQPVAPATPGEMNVFAAGSSETDTTAGSGQDLSFSASEHIDEGSVISIEVPGTFTISDPQMCELMTGALVNDAVPEHDMNPSPLSQLKIKTKDGTVHSFDTAEPYLIGTECWYCPGFFSQLHEAENQ